MRIMMAMAAVLAACETAGGDGAAVQAVAGPAVTVTVRAEGQLAVSWSADPAAVQYRVYQQAGGGAFAFLDSVGGSPPATSYVATGLSGESTYCYAVVSAFGDGGESAPSVPVCASPSGHIAAGTEIRAFAPVLAQNEGAWSAPHVVTDATGRSLIATTSLTGGASRIALTHDGCAVLSALTVLVSGHQSDANFVVERFNPSLPGGFDRLGVPTLDNGRGDSWSAVPVSVAAATLAADDILYLNLSVSTQRVGYSVGGVVATYDQCQ